ncbi:hypothetical protein F4859DRAFT_432377 [Xylaria cf. heliscus]|nr:hypothetical protein F4859DRAFT_432377 [Xylaria cf. heliscus]
MPPHSIAEWMVGQNFRRQKTSEQKPNGPRHVVSFEVLTDDESGSDLYKIAVPRGKPVQPRTPQVVSEPLKSALKQTSKIGLDSPTEASTDVSEETSDGDESTDEQPDPTCPCMKCIRGRRRLKQLEQARVKEKKKAVAVATAVSSGEETDDEIAAAVHTKHQAKKLRKKVSFIDDTTHEETESEASAVKARHQAKKDKKRSTAVVSMSSGDDSDSEASVVEAKVESKDGKVSMAMAVSSGDESESEASVVQKPQAKKGKKANKILTPESSPGESESDAAPVTAKQAKNKKANARKSKISKGDKSKDSRSTQKDKNKKKQVEESESSDSNAEDTASDAEEDPEEETKARSTKKGKKKGKDGGGKQERQQKANSKKADKKNQQKKSRKKRDKSASEPESESVSETEPESEIEVEVLKKAKTKKLKKKVSFPPAYAAPDMREPNLLLPPRTSVMQVEHAVEVPQDPRPNAFYDNDSGTMRVYHGPAYGNPYGALYPKRVYNYQNLPVGVPHPMQNPWYNGFPTVNGQPAPPHIPPPQMPPQGGAIDETNPWFRGWGTVGPAPIPANMPPVPASTRPPPEFAAGRSKNDQGYYGDRRSLSPPKDREAGWDSNVIPSIEVTAPNGSPTKVGSPSGSIWGAQGASGPKRSSDKQAEKKKRKKDVMNLDAAISDKLANIGKALQEAAAKDSADLRAREERWSNRSGSSKEASPQPNSGWGDNANNSTSNNNNNAGWDTGTGNNGGWDNNNNNSTNNNNNGGGSGWDAPNTNTGGDSSWDNAAANNNNNSNGNGWGNSGWDNGNTTNNNNNGDANNGGWGQSGSNSGWDNNNNNDGWGNSSNNAGPSNTANNNNNSWPDNRSNNSWTPGAPPLSPPQRQQDAPPIPGTWASPVPSHSGGSPKGKGKETGNGWGDATLAQSSGGYWDTKEGQADIAGGSNAKKDAKDGNGSW